jgi:hypothetical protein
MIRRGIVIPEYEEIYQEVTESIKSSSPEETVPEETVSDVPVSKEEGAEDR